MPVLPAPLFGFSLGVLFAWVARDELARVSSARFGARALPIVTLFACLVFVPACGYFVTFATDWSFAYLIDGRRVPSAVLLLLVLLDGASVIAGFASASESARQRKLGPVLRLGLLPIAAALAIVAALLRRLSLYGTFSQVGRAISVPSITGSPVGYAVLWFGACVLLGAAWTVRELAAPQRGARLRG